MNFIVVLNIDQCKTWLNTPFNVSLHQPALCWWGDVTDELGRLWPSALLTSSDILSLFFGVPGFYQAPYYRKYKTFTKTVNLGNLLIFNMF